IMRLKPLADQAMHLQRRLQIHLTKIRSAIGFPGLAVLAVGTVVAFSCTLWATYKGVPLPLAIMAGYCTVLVSACFCALLVTDDRSYTKIPTSKNRQPNYAAWRLIATLRISDAARLWSGIEPGCPVSQETIAWAEAMLDAIKRGELPILERKGIGNRHVDQER